MAERLKRAAAWLGLVTDDRYAEYDDADSQELTEGLSREELIGSKAAQQPAGTPTSPEKAASVTPLEPRRTAASVAATPKNPPRRPASYYFRKSGTSRSSSSIGAEER